MNGLSNKEIAATLFFVGVHTVEVHLSNVYCGSASVRRNQLARTLASTTELGAWPALAPSGAAIEDFRDFGLPGSRPK